MRIGSAAYIQDAEEASRFRKGVRRDRRSAVVRKSRDLWFRIAGDRINQHQTTVVEVRGSYQQKREDQKTRSEYEQVSQQI